MPSVIPARLPRLVAILGLTALVALGGPLIVPGPTAAAASGQTFHVDCRARAGGDGSTQAPWNSLGRVNGHAAFQAGDSILIKRGTTCNGALRPAGNGRADAPILIGAYGPGRTPPTIAGGGTGQGSGAVQLQNQSYWTIQDLHITNRGRDRETPLYRSGVLLQSYGHGRSVGVTLQRLRIDQVVSSLIADGGWDPREFGGISAITAPNQPHAGFDRLTILNSSVSQVGRTGIVVSNHNFSNSWDRQVRISGNTVRRARGDSIVLRGSINARIDHNVSADGADFWPCKQCGPITPATANAGIWPAYTKGTIIEYNEVYGTHAVGGDGEGIDTDISAENTIVQYNYVHDNDGGGILFCGSKGTVARFNILENNKQGAFTFIRSIPAMNTSIYNNTVYSRVGNYAKVVRSFGAFPSSTNRVRGVSFFNNLIYNMDDSGFYTWPTTPSTRTNTYIGVHGIDEPSEVGKGWNDPGLRRPGSGGNGFKTLGGYKPVSSKDDPMGSRIPSSVKTDFFGKKVDWRKPPRGAAG